MSDGEKSVKQKFHFKSLPDGSLEKAKAVYSDCQAEYIQPEIPHVGQAHTCQQFEQQIDRQFWTMFDGRRWMNQLQTN